MGILISMKLSLTLPRLFRGSFFYIFLGSLLCLPAHAQFKFREPPNRQDPGALDSNNGMMLWSWFLQSRAVGSFALEGELVFRPAGAPSVSYDYMLEGNWTPAFERTRLTITDGERELLASEVHSTDGGTVVSNYQTETPPVPVDWGAPLLENLPFSWFDLLMPYLHWQDVQYLGPDRYLGRPAHGFQLVNPVKDAVPSNVVVTLDEDYAAVLKVEMYGNGLEVIKRMRVGGFRKFGDEWMVSSLTWEDRSARSSVRLNVYSFTNTPAAFATP